MRPPLSFEDADPGDARLDRGRVERAERRGDILGAVTVDLADEAQRQVQLLVALPARRRDPVHRRDQRGADGTRRAQGDEQRSEEHTSELQSLMRISYAVFCLKKKNKQEPT